MRAKAQRLLIEGRVAIRPLKAIVVDVEGDGGLYRVFVTGSDVAPVVCTCRAHGVCTHIEAALARVDAPPALAALLDDAVSARRAETAALGEACRAAGG
jgi:uncharacterized Zn finger protein